MSRLSELLEAVVASREDDAPRRVYADALLEEGDPLGEFIHVQCDLAAGGLTREEGIRRRRRERELLQAHETRWTAGLQGLAFEYAFARGFVDEVAIGAAEWMKRGPELFQAAPALRSVTLTGLQTMDAAAAPMLLNRLRSALASPDLRRLIGLEVSAVFYNVKQEPFDTLEMVSLGEQAMAVVVEAQLEHLRGLGVNGPGAMGMTTLARAPVLPRLERVSINSSANVWATADPGLVLRMLDPARLRSLAIDRWHPGVARLSGLEVLQLGVGHSRAPALPSRLRELEYRAVNVSREEMAMISGCTELEGLCLVAKAIPVEELRLPKLRVLRVYSPEFTVERARSLVAERLEVLEVNRASAAECAELERILGCVVQVRRPKVSMLYARW